MAYCTQCGSPLDDAGSCPRCGTKARPAGRLAVKAVLMLGVPLVVLGVLLGVWLSTTVTPASAEKAAEQAAPRGVMTDEGRARQALAMGASFKKLAGADFNTALAMLVTPDGKQAWDKMTAGLFSAQVDAAAFFDTAFVQVLESSGAGTFRVMIYNLWIDAAVMAQFETVGDGPKITVLKIVSAGSPGRPQLIQPKLLLQELRRRLSTAAETDLDSKPFTLESCRGIQAALTDYRKSLRDSLAPDASADHQALANTVGLLLEECRAATSDSPLLADHPREWLAALHPVYLSQASGKSLLALSATHKPGRWLLVEIVSRGQTSIISHMTVGSVNEASER